jgi:hypothetical protein
VLVLFSLLATLTTGEPGELLIFAARNHHCQAKTERKQFQLVKSSHGISSLEI